MKQLDSKLKIVERNLGRHREREKSKIEMSLEQRVRALEEKVSLI